MGTDHGSSTAPSRRPGHPADGTAPPWFRKALRNQAICALLEHDEGRVSYRTWGEGERLVVLIHGRSANSHWWDHIAPQLVESEVGTRLIAIDLPGHGDSAWRATYNVEAWSRDVARLIEAERGRHDPVVIGHSMGASVALVLASLHLVPLTGVVAIDSPVGIPHTRNSLPSKTKRRYETRVEAESRFRLMPTDQASLDFVERHLASYAVRQHPEGGWTWKTDPAAMAPVLVRPEELAPFDVPVLAVLAERGLATAASTEKVFERAQGTTDVITIQDSGHHVMVDQPRALASRLRLQLARWSPVHE